jgi:hypothetical protein
LDTVAAIIGAVVSLFLVARSLVDRRRAQVVGINAGVFSGIDTFTGYTALERTLIVEVACQEDLDVALLGFEIERPRSGLLRLKKDSVVLIPRRWPGPDLPHRTEGHQATWVVPPEDFAPFAGTAGTNLKFNLRPFATVIRGSEKKVVRGADIRGALLQAAG